MKKIFKRIIPLAMAIVLCVCMAAPAFASSTVQSYMGDYFPTRGYSGSGYTSTGGYVGLIQRVMCAYSNSTHDAIVYNSGSIDEGYGDRTKTAVTLFQSAVGLGTDGIVGPKTWKAIANRVSYYRTTSSGYKQFSVSGYVVMSLSSVTSSNGSYYVSSSSDWYYYIYSDRNNSYIYYNSAFDQFI